MPRNIFVNEFHTNWHDQVITTVVEVEKTNLISRTVTNNVVVNAVRTNVVQAYLTNWETVVVMRTNWVTKPVTNVAQVDLAAQRTGSAPKAVTKPKEAAREIAVAEPAAAPKEAFTIQAARTARPPANDQAEVVLSIGWIGAIESPPQVQRWRVERDDGAILSFGQDQEFKRELPVGTYKVEAKLRREEDGPVLTLRGTLLVSLQEAVVQQLVAKN